jgi:hypothetical protein
MIGVVLDRCAEKRRGEMHGVAFGSLDLRWMGRVGRVMRRRCMDTVCMRDGTGCMVYIAAECIDGLYLPGLLPLLICWCWRDDMRYLSIETNGMMVVHRFLHLL